MPELTPSQTPPDLAAVVEGSPCHSLKEPMEIEDEQPEEIEDEQPEQQEEIVPKPQGRKRKAKELVAPTRRVRGKQSVQAKKKRGAGGKGNPHAKGKKEGASIAQKEAICAEYEKAIAKKKKRPAKVVEGMPGYYTGCIYESKWMGVRRKQKWTVLVQAAPKLARKHKELPDSLRTMLQLPKKFSNRLSKSGASLNSLPVPMQECVASIIKDYVEMGQEMDIEFVKGIVVQCVEMWNECVESIRNNIEDLSIAFLKSKDQELSEMSPAELDKVVADFRKDLDKTLLPVDVKAESERAMRCLGSKGKVNLEHFHIFIYVHIHTCRKISIYI